MLELNEIYLDLIHYFQGQLSVSHVHDCQSHDNKLRGANNNIYFIILVNYFKNEHVVNKNLRVTFVGEIRSDKDSLTKKLYFFVRPHL